MEIAYVHRSNPTVLSTSSHRQTNCTRLIWLKILYVDTMYIVWKRKISWLQNLSWRNKEKNFDSNMKKATSATKLRLTQRGTIGICQCKVGACPKCGAACKRCKCRCPGYSVLETIERMRLRNQKDKSIKKKVKPQRKRQESKLITESSTRSSKRSKASRDWSYINDDDSTFLPSIYKINVTKNKKSDSIVKPIAIQPINWLKVRILPL